MRSETKPCQKCQKSFIIEPDDFGFYEKIGVLAPALCPDCRMQKRLLWRNERSWYKRACDLCKRTIIATYPADAPFPVYCVKCWWSDSWDPYSYGKEYDLNRSFFEQFKELLNTVPALAMINDDTIGSVNSEYTYDFAFSKNCYMGVSGWYNENTMYSAFVNRNKDIIDCYCAGESEVMYESINCQECFGCSYCMNCASCRNCFGGFDLHGCSDCAFSVGLRNKKFHIFNQPYSEVDYQAKLKEMGFGTRRFWEENKGEFEKLIAGYPHKYAQIRKSVATTGDYLVNCKNSKECFYHNSLENCRFMVAGDGAKDSYDCNHTGEPELCYNGITPDHSRNCITTIFSWECVDVFYSNMCRGSENLLGCNGLRKGSYVILNKKYSKEEYEALKGKIVAQMKAAGEWGDFFPVALSPFAYNESASHEWFPLTKDEALKQGFRWKDEEAKVYQVTLPSEKLTDTIDTVTDEILKETIGCAHVGTCNQKCSTAFRITSAELGLYRRLKIPIPKLCGNCRHYERVKLLNPPKLWHRQCVCLSGEAGAKSDVKKNTVAHFHGDKPCPNEFETAYAPERPEIIYCEQCYQAEVI